MAPGEQQVTVINVYTMNDGAEIISHTDPSGQWHAGVAATVWDSSLVLSKHFEKVLHGTPGGDETKDSHKVSKLFGKQAGNILELGAGCSALPSVVLSRLFCTADHSSFQFHVTDKEGALSLLQKSIGSNETCQRFHASILDWHTKPPPHISERVWDIIVASDLLAFPDLYESLNETLTSLSSAKTLVYIAYERRNFSTEIEFFRILGNSFNFEMVQESELDEVWRAPGEIYLYRAWLKQ